MKTLFTILGLFVVLTIKAEHIDGPANIRFEPKGELKFSINDNQYVYAYEAKNDWFEIMLTALVRKSDLLNVNTIKPNSDLFDYKYQKIGVTKPNIDISGYWIETDSSDWIEIMIYGFTHKNNIRPESILEREVERIINNELYNNLTEMYNKFDFREYAVDEYYVYIAYDVSDPWMSADFRMMIYCDRNKKIIGIANKGRELDLNNKLESTIDRGYKMQYIHLLSDNKREEFEKKMTDNFKYRD